MICLTWEFDFDHHNIKLCNLQNEHIYDSQKVCMDAELNLLSLEVSSLAEDHGANFTNVLWDLKTKEFKDSCHFYVRNNVHIRL